MRKRTITGIIALIMALTLASCEKAEPTRPYGPTPEQIKEWHDEFGRPVPDRLELKAELESPAKGYQFRVEAYVIYKNGYRYRVTRETGFGSFGPIEMTNINEFMIIGDGPCRITGKTEHIGVTLESELTLTAGNT